VDSARTLPNPLCIAVTGLVSSKKNTQLAFCTCVAILYPAIAAHLAAADASNEARPFKSSNCVLHGPQILLLRVAYFFRLLFERVKINL
jgi:hypothetical protein